jgi:ribosomal protein L6P/L9E
MKKLVLLFALLVGFTFNAAANNGNRDLMKRINNRLGFSAAEKAQLGSGVAVVTFTIDGNGQINIQHCDATTEAQKQAVIERLNKFYVHNAPVSTDAVYMIKIDFTQR